MPKKKIDPEDKSKDVQGRIILLKAVPYKGYWIYLLRIDKDLFTYLVSKSEIFLGHLVVTPGKDGKPLNDDQVAHSGMLAFAGATTTVDMQLEKENPKGGDKHEHIPAKAQN